MAVAAARNNADWCDVVCRAHGLPTGFDDRVWRSARRTPQFYPDAVTLSPEATEAEVLAGIDAGEGCSIKDSFATLDLSGYGFQVLFDAEWITREPPTVDGSTWVESAVGWDFAADLIDDPAVAMLVAPGREAGVVANLSGAEVVGLSNFFATGDPETAWGEAVRAVAARFPGRRMVGYESGDDLPPALAAGFHAAGPLRVWLRTG